MNADKLTEDVCQEAVTTIRKRLLEEGLSPDELSQKFSVVVAITQHDAGMGSLYCEGEYDALLALQARITRYVFAMSEEHIGVVEKLDGPDQG